MRHPRTSASCPGRTFGVRRLMRDDRTGKGACGQARGASRRRPARCAGCPAVLGLGAPAPNSLRELRSLRSNSRAESDVVARCARGPRALRSSAPPRRAPACPHAPLLLWRQPCVSRNTAISSPRRAGPPAATRDRPTQVRESSCATTATATTSGCLPEMPPTPIGHMIRSINSAARPRCSKRCMKRWRLVFEPIRPR
jgi:hypothetical protein